MLDFMPVFGFLPNIGIPELLLIMGIALIVIGPGKLPEAGKALGKTISEFKKARTEVIENPDSEEINVEKNV